MSPVIDVHVHVYSEQFVRDRELISKKEPHFDLLTHNKVHKWGTAEQLIQRMDETGVDQSWIFGFAFRDPGLCAICNDYVIDAVRRYPGRLKGFASISPLTRGFAAEAERCADAGLIGVGELFPQGQNFGGRRGGWPPCWRNAGCCSTSIPPNRWGTITTARATSGRKRRRRSA